MGVINTYFIGHLGTKE
jgi:multidrug resistance protein, MATE family